MIVYTDASVMKKNENEYIGAWGFIAMINGKVDVRWGQSPKMDDFGSCTLAEFYAILYAVRHLDKLSVKEAIIKTDCMAFVTAVQAQSCTNPSLAVPLLEIKNIIIRSGIKLEFQHVRAHQKSKKSFDSKYNNLVDKIVNDHARLLKNQIKINDNGLQQKL